MRLKTKKVYGDLRISKVFFALILLVSIAFGVYCHNFVILGEKRCKYLSNIEIIDLRENPINNNEMKKIKRFKGLRILDLRGSSITNAEQLKYVTTLESLAIGNPILEGPTDFSFLNSLDLNTFKALHLNHLTDLSPLMQMNNLSNVEFTFMNLGSDVLRQLSEIPNICVLSLKGSNIESFEFLINMKHLKSIDLHGTNFSQLDIEYICSINSLEEINLVDTDIYNYDFLLEFKQLNKVTLNSSRISDFDSSKLQEYGVEVILI